MNRTTRILLSIHSTQLVYTTTGPNDLTKNLSPTVQSLYYFLSLENQAKYFHEHAGHESTHSKMAMIIIFALVAFQFVLLWWKKHHYRSYQATTTIGLW